MQILTKGDGSRDFDLLDQNDWYGITLDGSESIEVILQRMVGIYEAIDSNIKTWVSFEPVINKDRTLEWLSNTIQASVDRVKIGKLNYYKSDIDWKAFGHEAEAICKAIGINYYIKDSLRKEMEK